MSIHEPSLKGAPGEVERSITASTAPTNSRGKVLFASLIGTTIEYYDFYIYATAAVVVFPYLFFITSSPSTALLASLASFGVAFFARPIGGVLFGHFGDRIGRKGTLVASLLTMGLGTFAIGLIPSATTPGWEFLAPALLVLMRFAQGLGLGGEWSGAVLLATENAPEGKRAIYGSFPQLGTAFGFIIANGLFLLLTAMLSAEAFLAWGWRIPFLASALMVIVGLWVRLSLVESTAFKKVVEEGEVAKLPLARVFKTSWKAIIIGTFSMVSLFSLVFILSTFTLSYGTTPTTAAVPGLGYDRPTFMLMIVVGAVAFAAFTLIAGPFAERFGRRRVLIVSMVLIIALGLLFVPLLSGGTPGVMTLLLVGFALLGLSYGPMGAFQPELFPANVRYTGSALSFNISSILGGALAPLIAVALWSVAQGSPVLVGLYLSGMCVISLIALLVSRETKDVAYNDNIS
ncbi:MFS transporter [Arthrobacter sp. EpRS71]|uniref:MFS transporter n=1 Tax=Arthrobacter sp. EpRS71 TaxID=1743141 RepID=UPI0009E7F46C|nr:MFS transporter [Arthrobacter sp. EpRS71]